MVRLAIGTLLAVFALGCDENVVPRAVGLSMGGDQACLLGVLEKSEDAGTPPVDAGPGEDAGIDAGVGDDAGAPMDAGPGTSDASVVGYPFCWGNGDPNVTPLPGARSVAQMAIGPSSCGVVASGELYCWGANDRGQLGDGTTDARSESRVVPGLRGVTAVDVARFATPDEGFACALTSVGVQCWGANDRGQLGDGLGADHTRPASITARTPNFVGLALGTAHACALTDEGTVQCWGANDLGQLGDRTTTDRNYPSAVAGIDDAVQIVAGANHTCALLADGKVACWGDSSEGQGGQLGITFLSPNLVEIDGVVQIAAGAQHACGVTGSGDVACWGANAFLQAGNGAPVSQPRPTTITLGDAVEVSAGLRNTCARLSSGSVRCWGSAESGVLGGVTGDNAVPARVPGTP